MTAPLLARLIVELETQERLSPDVARWLHAGACEFQAGRSKSLCGALGLRGRGIALPATQAALAARNGHLREAFAHVVGATAPQRLDAFRHLVGRFSTDAWPRVRHLRDPPERFNAIQRALFRAHATGIRPPSSRSQLAAIVGETA